MRSHIQEPDELDEIFGVTDAESLETIKKRLAELDAFHDEMERLAAAIKNWDGNNIVDLKHAIDEFEKFRTTRWAKRACWDSDIYETNKININALPRHKIPKNFDSAYIWACDVNGRCLAGDEFPGQIASLAYALRDYNYASEIDEWGEAAQLTTDQAGVELAIMRSRDIPYSVNQINAYINNGHLRAKKRGRDWIIRLSDLAKIKDRRPGHERKSN